jgi:predicted nucleic acid-binding protein
MTGQVIDASVTLPSFFPDEADRFTEAVLDSIVATQTWAPLLWCLECGNAILVASRRGRIGIERRVEIAAQLGLLPVNVDREPVAIGVLDALADRHGLTVYDAAYLELAIRRSLPLVTLDARLAAAARAARHPVRTRAAAARATRLRSARR